MKVRITNGQGSFWYEKHVGEVFEVERVESRHGVEYRVLPFDPNGSFYIAEEDCEVVEE